jgi:hypothetical protein
MESLANSDYFWNVLFIVVIVWGTIAYKIGYVVRRKQEEKLFSAGVALENIDKNEDYQDFLATILIEYKNGILQDVKLVKGTTRRDNI